MIRFILLLLAFSFQSQAAKIQFNTNVTEPVSVLRSGEYKIELSTANYETLTLKQGTFTSFQVEGINNSNSVGAPELPVKTWLLKGKPEDISVKLNVQKKYTVKNMLPVPVQPQKCRCENDKKIEFKYNRSAYVKNEAYSLKYLGSFRGTPITRLDVSLAEYNSQDNSVTFNTKSIVNFDAPEFSLEKGDYKDYLIVVNPTLEEGTKAFASWKVSQGFNVNVVAVELKTTTEVATLIKSYYEKGTDFVIVVGDEKVFPMNLVDTSGSSRTPSDLYYFTMDGANDTIPDMFYSRLVASNSKQLAEQLNKFIEFEKKSYKDLTGLQKIIGIASNEGSNPSDNEYVKSIEESFAKNMGTTSTHLYQNDVQSNPTTLNKSFDVGSFWLTYLGHGSGTSWPSMNKEYYTSDTKNIKNEESVKPVIIDVACQNGRLISSYLGSTFMSVSNNNPLGGSGALAYYGGTVNISWHPPAVMARGIAFEHMAKNFKHLGEALLAGQLYLAANWTDSEDVVDNFEWYHLQGDPGLNVDFK